MGKTNQHKPDYLIAGLVLFLVMGGVVMVYSSSYYLELVKGDPGTDFFRKQAIGVIIGLVVMFVLSITDYHLFSNRVVVFGLVVAALALLIVVYFMPAINDAHRWIILGEFKFQPSEVARFALIIVTAKVFSIRENIQIARSYHLKEIVSELWKYFAGVAAAAALIIMEPSLTVAILMLLVVLSMLFAVGVKWRWMFLLGGIASVSAALAIIAAEFRSKRVVSFAFLTPWNDPTGVNYQPLQSLLALASGGLFGVGFTNSKQKLLYLTYGNSDYIYSIIGEELGFIGLTVLLIIFLVIIVRGFVVALNSRDLFGTLLATGITSMIAVQTIMHVAVAVSIVPSTGIPLPFISAGSTSLIIFMAEIGILLNISRQNNARRAAKTA